MSNLVGGVSRGSGNPGRKNEVKKEAKAGMCAVVQGAFMVQMVSA